MQPGSMVYYKKFLKDEHALLVIGKGESVREYLTSVSITTKENPYGKGDAG